MKNMKITTIQTIVFVLISTALTLSLQAVGSECIFDMFGIDIPKLNPLEIPKVETMELRNGMRIILMQDNSLPVIEINGINSAGSAFDPAEKKGLMSLMYSLMVSGGTESFSPLNLDELLGANAIGLNLSCRVQLGYIQMDFLAKDLDLSFSLLKEVLTSPIFTEERIETEKMIMKNMISRRGTRQADLAQDELWKAVAGADNPYGRTPGVSDIDNIFRQDLVNAHQKYVRPEGIVLTIFGDFELDDLRAKAEDTFGGWVVQGKPEDTPIVQFERPKPAVHLVPYPNATQAWVYLAHQGNLRPTDDDFYAMELINHILGNSFSGRIIQRIRVQLGLAYSPGARYISGFGFPGLFYMFTQTRNDRVVDVIEAMIEEAHKIRDVKIPFQELQHAKSSYINSFVFSYDSNRELMRTLAEYKMFDVPFEHLENIVPNIKELTQDDIQRVAKEYIRPDLFSIVITGNHEDYIDRVGKFGELILVDTSTSESPKHESGTGFEERQRNEVERILQRYASSLGDIGKVENVYFEGVSTEFRHNEQSQVTITAFISYPGKIKQQIHTPSGPVEMIYNNGRGILYFPGSSMPLPPEFLEQLGNNLRTSPIGLIKYYIDEFEVRLLDRLIIKDIDSYMLAFKKGDDEFILVIDSKNYLPHQSIHQTFGIDGPEILYKDIVEYRRFDGILYPVKIVTRNNYGEIVSEVEYNRIEFNIELEEDLFDID